LRILPFLIESLYDSSLKEPLLKSHARFYTTTRDALLVLDERNTNFPIRQSHLAVLDRVWARGKKKKEKKRRRKNNQIEL
jgi:hypothetical protein